MRKVSFMGKKSFKLQEISTPTPGPGELLIRNAACGVCGTDVHIYYGEPGSAEVKPPVVLGHEYAGIVEAVGPDVSVFRIGDHVTIDPNMYCGVCRYCRDGKKQLCEEMQAIGVTQDGGFATHSVVPAAQAYQLHKDLPLESGAMAEPLACCIHGIDSAAIRSGDTVLVIGGGTIGLLMLQLAKLAGAAQVILSEPVSLRRDIALSLGANACIDPVNENPAQRIKELTGKDGADIVIECAGNTSATRQAFEAAAKGATLLLFSVPTVDASYSLSLFDVYKKELTIKGSFINPDTHARAVALLESGRIQIAPLITHRFPLDHMDEAIQTQMGSDSIKVLVIAD